MRVSYARAAFPDSAIADRVVSELKQCSQKILEKMKSEDMLEISDREAAPYQNLSYRNLKWECLDAYALITEKPLSYFIFGESVPTNMEFSFFDEEIFALIDVTPRALLDAATLVMQNTFPNEKMQIGTMPANKKIISLALLNPRLPKLVSEDELGKYRTNINDLLLHYRKSRVKERCMINIDHIVDLCAYFKVSPHWAFSLVRPLLFEHSNGDRFFDTFCLLSRQQQVYAIAMLAALYPAAEKQLKPELWQQIQQIIAIGGGAAL